MRSKQDPQVVFLLADVCKQRGITVQALSRLSGVSTGAIGDLRSGKNSLPRRDTLARLCRALQVTPGDLIKLA